MTIKEFPPIINPSDNLGNSLEVGMQVKYLPYTQTINIYKACWLQNRANEIFTIKSLHEGYVQLNEAWGNYNPTSFEKQ